MHAQWGTFELRVGGGYGAFDDGPSPHVALTLAGGARAYPSRRHRTTYNPPGLSLEIARPWRVFGTLRRTLEGAVAHALVFGLEITPAFLLAPRDTWQLIGDNSH